MPEWSILVVLILLAIAAVRWERRLHRRIRGREEAEVDAVRRQVERKGGRF